MLLYSGGSCVRECKIQVENTLCLGLFNLVQDSEAIACIPCLKTSLPSQRLLLCLRSHIVMWLSSIGYIHATSNRIVNKSDEILFERRKGMSANIYFRSNIYYTCCRLASVIGRSIYRRVDLSNQTQA
jgi:hypothetical protein